MVTSQVMAARTKNLKAARKKVRMRARLATLMRRGSREALAGDRVRAAEAAERGTGGGAGGGDVGMTVIGPSSLRMLFKAL